MKKIIVLLSTFSILFCGAASSFGQQAVSEEAIRHCKRGAALAVAGLALRLAKSPEDFKDAIKEFEDAINEYRQVIMLAPDWPDVYHSLGGVQEMAGKYRDAITSFKQYLRLAPNASDAALVKRNINELEFKAEQEITEAKRHFDRGMAAVEMAKSPDDYAAAIKEFTQAAALAPDWPDVYYNLGLVQEKAGKYRDAITSLKQYRRLAPNASDAQIVQSLIYKLEFKAEQEITEEVALDIYGSLSDSTKWRYVGEGSAYKNWVTGLRRDGDRIWITYFSDLSKWTQSSFSTGLGKEAGVTFKVLESAELERNALSLEYIFTYSNFCDKPSCDVFGKYIFKIVSKNKVRVEGVEIFPKRFDGTIRHITFEYIRIQM
jgi:tetratricopeptide (TPR) repeat protein